MYLIWVEIHHLRGCIWVTYESQMHASSAPQHQMHFTHNIAVSHAGHLCHHDGHRINHSAALNVRVCCLLFVVQYYICILSHAIQSSYCLCQSFLFYLSSSCLISCYHTHSVLVFSSVTSLLPCLLPWFMIKSSSLLFNTSYYSCTIA